MTGAVGAVLAVVAGVGAVLVAAGHADQGPTIAARATRVRQRPATPTPIPSPTGSSAAQTALLRYVAQLPSVHDVDASTVDEYTELVCETLRSPKMSPAFFQQLLSIEEHGYALTRAQTVGLLTATAQAGCPDAEPVIRSSGATTK